MDRNESLELDDDFLYFSIIYSSITVIFAVGVLYKCLTSELEFGFRSLFILGVLFIGEPLCHFLLRGSTGAISFAIICLFLYSILPASELPVVGKTVLITAGCDSGFGHALAICLDKLGMTIYAGCLYSDGPGALSLISTCSHNLHVLKLDITKDDDVNAAYNYVKSEQGSQGLWGLVNCVSIFYLADAELTPSSIYERTIATNYLGAVRTTRTFLPLIRQARGRVVNLASLTGRLPLVFCGAYTASMHALHGFSQVLRKEMKRFGVSVTVVEPGCVKKSPSWASSLLAKKLDLWSQVSPDCHHTYDQTYIDDLYESYAELVNNMSEDLSPVVCALRASLLSRRAREHYACGAWVDVLTALYPILPVWLTDRLVSAVYPTARLAQPTPAP